MFLEENGHGSTYKTTIVEEDNMSGSATKKCNSRKLWSRIILRNYSQVVRRFPQHVYELKDLRARLKTNSIEGGIDSRENYNEDDE